MKQFIKVSIIILLALFWLTCGGGDSEKGKGSPGKKRGKGMKGGEKRIISVFRTNINQELEESGEIAPIAEADITSRISGRVIKIMIKEGMPVHKGSKIAEVEPDYNQTRSLIQQVDKLDNAKLDYEKARDDYEEDKELFEKGFLPENQFIITENRFIKAERSYKATKIEYEASKKELGMKELKVQKLPILSPLSGIILNKYVEEGELITGETSMRSGTKLFQVADLSRLVVRIDVNEVDIYKLNMGYKVDISIAANPTEKYTGIVYKISPYARNKSGIKVFATEIKINQKDSRLRPGMSAVVNMVIQAKKGVLAVPITSLFIENDKEYVFMMKKDVGPEKVFVKRGLADEYNVEIISGLKEGMKVFRDIPYMDMSGKKKSTFIPRGGK